MSFFSDLGVIDIRDKLPHRNWIIGERAATTSDTWHYNGPAVAPAQQHGAGLIAQLIADSNWQMRASWGGTKDGAPHLMYHLVFDADGTIYQTAGEQELLWHCAHADGNDHGFAWHLPIGEGQEPTPQQLASLFRASDLSRARYGFGFERVVGHLEWKHATACPGPRVMAHLNAYRAHQAPIIVPTPTPAGMRRFKLQAADKVNVRQGPALTFPIAGTLKGGTIVFVDVVKTDGGYVGSKANPNWVHMAKVGNEQADLGFISETLGVWV